MAKGIVKGGNNDTPRLTGDAVEANVLSGKTFYTNDARTKKTGTMSERGTVNQSLPINGTYTIQEGHYNAGQITQSILTKSAITITPSNVQQTISAGQYLTGDQVISAVPVDASKVLTGTTIANTAGNMPENGTQSATLNITGSAKPSKAIPAGHCNASTITAQLDASLASKILQGNVIGGVTGTGTTPIPTAGDEIVALDTTTGRAEGYVSTAYSKTITIVTSGTYRFYAEFCTTSTYDGSAADNACGTMRIYKDDVLVATVSNVGGLTWRSAYSDLAVVTGNKLRFELSCNVGSLYVNFRNWSARCAIGANAHF